MPAVRWQRRLPWRFFASDEILGPVLYLAIPIVLMIGVAILNELGGSDTVQFFDHLAISGIVAGVIVFLFF